MKVILSRKGFDSTYGRQPSPILPDGTLLSLPIPMENEKVCFENLVHKDKSYYDIIQELKPKTHLKKSHACHLDPDLRKEAIKRADQWKPLFGQAGSALSHLRNQGIAHGDLFLFFGTFKQTEYDEHRRLQYKKKAAEQHLIYGYFQVGQLHTAKQILETKFADHPHAQDSFTAKNQNGIFEATERLSFSPKLPGAGTLNYHKSLVLTKANHSKSRWSLPDEFKNLPISYHSGRSFKQEGYFKSAAIGQEFVITDHPSVHQWAKNMIKSGIE